MAVIAKKRMKLRRSKRKLLNEGKGKMRFLHGIVAEMKK